MDPRKTTRRVFLKGTAIAGGALWLASNHGRGEPNAEASARKAHAHRARGTYKANEKLNVAGVGVGNKGSGDIAQCRRENVVALCDIDFEYAAGTLKQYPKARKYHDYRVMFDEMHKNIDAITCSTPDHMHASISVHAMRLGKHVYCQKPLAHDVYEARLMAQVAKEHNVATQMGNQGTADDGLRSAVEAIQAGVIGKVTEVHVWSNRPLWPQGQPRPKGSDVIPPSVKWDLFVGTAPMRPFKKDKYHPFNWRGWWDFGTGALGDMGCHTANLPFMALQLDAPTKATAECSIFDKDSFPTWSAVSLDFPARGKLPPLKWTWYDGGKEMPHRVYEMIPGLIHGSGSLLVGDKGMLYSPGEGDADWSLLPEKDFEGFKSPPQTLPRIEGEAGIDQKHMDEWIAACKEPKKRALSDFSRAGPFTETLLLGNIAVHTGKTLLWDGPRCRITNCPEGQALVCRQYRKGWEQL